MAVSYTPIRYPPALSTEYCLFACHQLHIISLLQAKCRSPHLSHILSVFLADLQTMAWGRCRRLIRKCSADEGGGEGGEPVKFTGTWMAGRGLEYVVYILSAIQINPFRPSPNRFGIEILSFRFSVKNFSRCALAQGPKNIFSSGPEPTFGGLVYMVTQRCVHFVCFVVCSHVVPFVLGICTKAQGAEKRHGSFSTISSCSFSSIVPALRTSELNQ